MFTLHQNALIFQTDEEPDYDHKDPASLQVMTQDHYPIDSKREVEYLNL